MTKRAVVFISVFGAGLAFASATPPSAVRAQSADLALCDRIAADPSDPDKPAEVRGATQIDSADIPLAIKYCKAASGGSRRAMYALGRAYAAGQKQPEAIAAYRKAADKGSTSAMVEMGVAYATGSGVERDEAKARTLFERAANSGNARGYTNLAAMGGGTAYSDPVQMRGHAVEIGGIEFGRGAVSARADARRRRRRDERRGRGARAVREGRRAKSSGRDGESRPVREERPRRSDGQGRGEKLFRARGPRSAAKKQRRNCSAWIAASCSGTSQAVCSAASEGRSLPETLARPKRFELLTPRFVVWCSIQLSYGRIPVRRDNYTAPPLFASARSSARMRNSSKTAFKTEKTTAYSTRPNTSGNSAISATTTQ